MNLTLGHDRKRSIPHRPVVIIMAFALPHDTIKDQADSPLFGKQTSCQGQADRGSLQEQVVAGWHAGLAMVQEKAQAGYEATRERVGIAQAGQELLSSGGDVAELAIRAKVAARSAAEQGDELTQRAKLAAASFEQAAQLLRTSRASAENVPQGVGGVEAFERLAQSYEARAALYRKLLDSLEEELPSPPEMTPVEQDAARILHVSDHCKLTSKKVVEGTEYLRQRTMETLSSAPESNILTSRCNGRSVCL
eukprot:gb/GFBE01017811.1/.p1 GENE.gb/GFBE01017811.1/~~gb/GFBE01017811.1/.p1  ORF type:complete len:251 (+),score=52.87 gb/GFBE01017811.1/:1-753(+)